MLGQFWCYMCSQMVNLVRDSEMKCPFCENGFLEEISSTEEASNSDNDLQSTSENAVFLLAPILLGLVGGLDSLNLRIMDQESTYSRSHNEEMEMRHESLVRRRIRRSAPNVLHMLQDDRSRMPSESESSHNDREGSDQNSVTDEALDFPGLISLNQDRNPNQNEANSFRDYLTGRGFDLLLQHLAENDPYPYGNLPAQKVAVKAMPTVTIEENMQCSVCLEDLEIGGEAKEMPCAHKFHPSCILLWLELHNSCPICRFQLPSDGS